MPRCPELRLEHGTSTFYWKQNPRAISLSCLLSLTWVVICSSLSNGLKSCSGNLKHPHLLMAGDGVFLKEEGI
jgi:hypothetical protein